MSRWGGPRGSGDDLAYGNLPQRWDRDRFEQLRGGGPPPRRFEEEYRFTERERPGRQDIAVADRIEASGPRGRFEERDRFVEEERFTPGGRKRRTDKELFGDVDPREIANLAITPYERKTEIREEIDYDRQSRAPPPRPGLLRRQSSLDTFDRRPIPRYTREEYRVPAYTPVPLPIRRPEREYEEVRYRDNYSPEDYREVEIQRERSVHRRRPSAPKSVKSSKTKSVTTRRSSTSSESIDERETIRDGNKSIHESFHESEHSGPRGRTESIRESVHESEHGGPLSRHESIHESVHESVHGSTVIGDGSVHESIQHRFKKGKTRMPKRLVRREAILDLGYPFDEEEDFFLLTVALEKEQIDEVIRISETYKSGGEYLLLYDNTLVPDNFAERKTVYKFEEKIDEAPPEPVGEHEEVTRTEWINPPSVVGTRRSVSHAGRSRSRAQSTANREVFEERKTVVEERAPSLLPPPPPPSAPPAPGTTFEERKSIYEERDTEIVSPSHHRSPSHAGTLVLKEREYRSDRDIQGEIARLEAERRALRLEREAEERRDLAVRIRERPEDEYQLVEYRDRIRPAREVLEITDRERSPPRNVVRVEKDRKGRMALVRSTH